MPGLGKTPAFMNIDIDAQQPVGKVRSGCEAQRSLPRSHRDTKKPEQISVPLGLCGPIALCLAGPCDFCHGLPGPDGGQTVGLF